MTREQALAGQDLAMLLERIGAARGLHPRNKQWPCPAADHAQTGDTPPASISHHSEGYDVWHCHSCKAGGTAIDALVVSGWEPDLATALKSVGVEDDHHQAPPRQEPESKRVGEYIYRDADGEPYIKVVRLEPKGFRQQRYEDGAWEWGLKGRAPVLYHLPDVLAAKAKGEWIIVCEGEKDADAARLKGYCATTNLGGAGKWDDGYTEALTGAKVVIIADDDGPGRKHAVAAFQRLYGKATRVGVRLPGKGHKDVAEHLAAGMSLNGDLRRAPELEDMQLPIGTQRAALTARAFASRPSETGMQILGPLFQRGMRTVIGAQTGEGKTTLGLQAISAIMSGDSFLEEAWRPQHNALRALVVDLEQGEETLKMRLREAGLDTCDRVEILWEPNGIALDARREDCAMVEDILHDGGYDLVLLDPLYQSHTGSANDERVAAATMRIVDEWARKYNCAFVVPMHARKPGTDDKPRKFTKHDIAGSGTWLRNSEFILGLQMHSAGFSHLHFFKDRIGFGPTVGSFWGLSFEREGGFHRNFNEDRQAAARTLKALVGRDEGATWDELVKVPGSVSQHEVNGVRYAGAGSIPNLLKKCDEIDGRYYMRKAKAKTKTADGQTDLLSSDAMT